jgi:hypothetical protein
MVAVPRQTVIAEGHIVVHRLGELLDARSETAEWSRSVAQNAEEIAKLARQAAEYLDSAREELLALGEPAPLRGEVGGFVGAIGGITAGFRAAESLGSLVRTLMAITPPSAAPPEVIAATAQLHTLFRDLVAQLETIDTSELTTAVSSYFAALFERLHADPSYRDSVERGLTEHEQGKAVPLDDALAEIDSEP